MTIEVVSMAGFATIQDFGRPGHRAYGVPAGGAMDVRSLAAANALVQNAGNAAAIEWALAGGAIRFLSSARIAIMGAAAEITHNGSPLGMNMAVDVAPDDELRVVRFRAGAFLYVAVRGGLDVPVLLGSRATYVPGAFGGLEGRRLRAGDRIRTARWTTPSRGGGDNVPPPANGVGSDDRPIRAIEGPNAPAFTREFREAFWNTDFTISATSSRAGYRLERGRASPEIFTSDVSEPACVGAIQVPTGGEAIVLMPDGPTVGGYPKIGVVASVDLGALAQRSPGSTVRFQRISLTVAHDLCRAVPPVADAGIPT